MRRRAWAAWGLVAVALVLGLTGAAADLGAFDIMSGLAWILAILLGLSLLPFWARIMPEVPPMPGLFTRPLEGQRWCVACGSPAEEDAACAVCGAPPRPRRERKHKSVQS